MVVHIAKSPETLLDLPRNEIDELIEQSKGFDFRQVQQWFNVLLQSDGDLSRSTFPKLILEMALLKMVDIQPVVPLDEILDRLDALAERLSRPGPGSMGLSDPQESDSPKPQITSEGESVPALSESPPAVDEDQEEETVSNASEDLQSVWNRILEFASREHPILGALVSHGQLLALNDRVIEIGFREGSFYYDRIQEDPNKRTLAEICRSLLKKDLQLVFSIIGRTSRYSSIQGAERETDRERRLRKEIIENPIVKDAMEIFGGEIEEIKVGARFESQVVKGGGGLP